MLNRLLPTLLAGICVALSLAAPPATAQYSNLDTVEGPNTGETTTLTITPHALSDNISARALGIDSPTSNRWALTLIGVTQADSIRLSLGDETVPIEDISRPGEGEVGPTRVYLSQKTFLTLAESSGVRLQVGEETMPLPEQMRKEMRQIFEEVS